MRRARLVAFVAALLLHAGFLFFGGLLLFRQHKAKDAKEQDVEIVAQEEKKQDVQKEKEMAEQKDKAPDAPPPELAEQAPQLDLAQLEMALNPGLGEGGGGDFVSRVRGIGPAVAGAGSDGSGGMDAIFSIADLDQAPRAVYQPAPEYPGELRRKKIEGSVYVLFLVDRQGRVASPRVQKSSHPAFEGPALEAIKRWRFDPGRRAGEAVQFRMRVPITFKNRG